MTAKGHYFTALSIGVIGGVLLSGRHYDGQYIEMISNIIHWSAESIGWGFFDPPLAVISLTFLCGCTVGAYAPDWLELSYIFNNMRKSVISHRTLTHTILFWMILVGIAYYFLHVTLAWAFILAWFCFGFSCAGLLHCLIDMLSPMGVPIVNPYKRLSLPVYKTGEASELKIILPIIGLAIMVAMNPTFF